MATSYNVKRLADTLKELTFREMQDIASYISRCVADCEGDPESTDVAEYLLGWADMTQEDAAREGGPR